MEVLEPTKKSRCVPEMMVQNHFVDVSIFDPPIKVNSPHQKAISHAILHGIVKEFTGEFYGVQSRTTKARIFNRPIFLTSETVQ